MGHALQMSIPKTEQLCYNMMQHSGHHHKPLRITRHEIEHDAKFKYLGSMQTSHYWQFSRAKVSN